jgi:sodium-dependent dicarboxylate transporter 2/3/5
MSADDRARDEAPRPQISEERREIRGLIQRLEVRSWHQAAQALGCLALAGAVSFLPAHAGLSQDGRHALFILVLAAGLWVSEAVAAYGVALLVVALEILLLGELGRDGEDWSRFLAPWASPLLWLFLGGFVLGMGATKTGLDRWLARRVLMLSGTTPARALFGLMAVGFTLSMFMSNTAAAATLLAIATPIAASRPAGDPWKKAVFLGVAVATNLGGMGTLIGSPPNAIAAGALGGLDAFDFTRWMLVGLPPALVLFVVSYAWLSFRYAPSDVSEARLPSISVEHRLPAWRQMLVIGVFGSTLLLWMTGGIHGVPTPVVSFLPITAFAATGILRAQDIRELQWDVLLLLFGGLALGLSVTETGLASWLVEQVPVSALGRVSLALGAAYATALLSNFMSNTAAANILIPIGVALGHGFEAPMAVSIALSASSAMCLPISTPPNAIAFAGGELGNRDFLGIGLVLAVIAPALAVAWCTLVLG